MKFFGALVLFGIFISTSSVHHAKAQNTEIHHGSLIKSIQEIYGTAEIIIVSDEPSQRTLKKLAIGYDTCRMLSNEGILSIVTNFKNFKERLTLYVKGIIRPLVVIKLDTMKEVHIFEKTVQNFTMSYAIWLIFFTGHTGQDICEYCRNPYGNPLHLRFDSQVLIICCESNVMEEWWSPIVNCTKRQTIGRWINEDHRLEWYVNPNLHSRRNSLEGRKLRIAAVRGFSIWEENGAYGGFSGEILTELHQSLNFTIAKFIWEDEYGRFDPETSKWTGVIGKIERNEADIGVSPLCMTQERLNVVDFTIPMAVGESTLFMKKLHGARIQWKAYFKAFAMDVWMVIITLILTMPLFLTLIRYTNRCHLLPMVIEYYSCVWGIYCQQGLSKFPKATPLRIVYVSIFISALVSASVYSASLVSFLTVFSSYSPFHRLEEFAKDGTYKLIMLKDSSQYYTYKNANDTLRRMMGSLLLPMESLPRNSIDGFRQVCQDGVAFQTSEINRKAVAKSIICQLSSIGTGTIETFGMITPRNSQYLGVINYRLQQFKNNGMFQRLNDKYFKQPQQNRLDYPKVHVEGIEMILYTLAGGYLITLMIFAIEVIFHRFTIKLHNLKLQKKVIHTKI